MARKAGLLCLLWASAVKDDLAAFEASTWWTEIELHPLIVAMKQLSPLFITIFALSLVWTLLRISVLRTRGLGLGVVFMVLQMYVVVRSSLAFPDLFQRLAFAFILQASALLYLALLSSKNGPPELRRWVAQALLTFFSIFIAVNMIHVALGYGFVPGNSRLFGTSAHPNFLGVQVALAAIALLHGAIIKTRGKAWLYGVGVLCALFLLLMSGSRTGVLVFCIGAGCYFLARRRFSSQAWILLFVFGTAVLFFLLFGSDILGESFDRGGANTRAGTISDLLARIYDNPLLGEGAFLGFSENSFLRGWAAFGILYPVVLISVCAVLLVTLARACVTEFAEKSPTLFFGLGCGICAGAFLEGYLTDAFGLPVLLFLILLGAVRNAVPSQDSQKIVAARGARPC